MRKLTFLTFSNILNNLILHEILTCDDKDTTRFKKNIKEIIQEKTMHKAYRNSSSNIVLNNCLRNIQVRLNSLIECAK